MKVVKVSEYGEAIRCYYHCPGCGYPHAFSPAVHQWNESRDNPTITPSLLQNNPQGHHACHSYIKDGKIQFLDDCWHRLKGQTVELPEIDLSQFDPDFVQIIN